MINTMTTAWALTMPRSRCQAVSRDERKQRWAGVPTLNGTLKTTAVLTNQETAQLWKLLNKTTTPRHGKAGPRTGPS